MAKNHLDPKIIVFLAKKLLKTEGTVRKDLSLLAPKYATVTPNARAQIYALANRTSIWNKLRKEDRASLPNIEVQKAPTIVRQINPSRNKGKIQPLVTYLTTDRFRRGHIDEINRAYHFHCYTSVFILLRKVVENMLVDILRTKFPENDLTSREMYFNTRQHRFHDFSVILSNLKKRSNDFGPENKLVEKIVDKANHLRDRGNDTVHSWYHLVTSPEEIKELEVRYCLT